MGHQKSKPRPEREKPARFESRSTRQDEPIRTEPDAESSPSPGSRLGLAAWLIGFLLLAAFLLFDLVNGLFSH